MCEIDRPPDRQEYIQVGSRTVAICRVFDLIYFRLNRLHLTLVILKVWISNRQYVTDVYVNVKLNFSKAPTTVNICDFESKDLIDLDNAYNFI